MSPSHWGWKGGGGSFVPLRASQGGFWGARCSSCGAASAARSLLTRSWDAAGNGPQGQRGSRGPRGSPAPLGPYLEQSEIARGQAAGPDDHSGAGTPPSPEHREGSVSVSGPRAGRAQAPEQPLSAPISARCSPERTRRAGGPEPAHGGSGGAEGLGKLRANPTAGPEWGCLNLPACKGG